jgi:hypothetical protein
MLKKGGQVTIFVIIGVLVIATVAVLLTLIKLDIIGGGSNVNPEEAITSCLEKELEDIEKVAGDQGGYIGSTLNKKIIDPISGIEVPFYCYTDSLDSSCEVIEPVPLTFIDSELTTYIQGKIDQCFDPLGGRSDVTIGATTSAEIFIEPNRVRLEVVKDVEIRGDSETLRLTDFEIQVNSNIYQFVYLSNRIINDEVYCDCSVSSCMADLVTLSEQNPTFEFDIENNNNGRVYKIKHYSTQKSFSFGVKNCVRF